jgi:hypothetical protein
VAVQGVSDMLMGAAGAIGGAASGLVLSGTGYFGLNMLAATVAAGVLAAASVTTISARRRSAAA